MKYYFTLFLLVIAFAGHSQLPVLERSAVFTSDASTSFISTVTDSDKNIYLLGYFKGNMDYNPAAGVSNITAAYNGMAVLKYDSAFIPQWAGVLNPTTASSSITRANLALQPDGSLIIAGSYTGSVDIDPGANVNIIQSNGNESVFVIKLTNAGSLEWVKTTGGYAPYSNMATDNRGNIYVCGRYKSPQVDFDPGTGVVNLANPYSGIESSYFWKLNINGEYQWVKTVWASVDGVTIDKKNEPVFWGQTAEATYDFNPGPQQHMVKTDTTGANFLLKLDTAGNFRWVKNFGGHFYLSWLNSVNFDSENNIYTTGDYTGTIDMDPSPVNFTFNSSSAYYLQKLDSAGNFIWARTMNCGYSRPVLTVNNNGDIYLIMSYLNYTDLDPGPGVYLNSNISFTGYNTSVKGLAIAKIKSNSNLEWAASMPWVTGYANCVTVRDNKILLSGSFKDSMDVNPGPATDILAGRDSFNSAYLISIKEINDSCNGLLLRTDSLLNITCSDSGYIQVHATGGTPPYQYSWPGLQQVSGNSLHVVTSKIYQIGVTDSTGCYRGQGVLIDGPGQDSSDVKMDIVTSPLRAGRDATLWLNAINKRCQPVNGSFTLVLDAVTTYQSATPAPDVVSGDSLTWNFSGLAYPQRITPSVIVSISGQVPANTIAYLRAFITADSTETDLAGNYCQTWRTVLNSYDPNDKQVLPKGNCDAGYVANKDRLTYIVRFQNTGNAPAYDVVIIDTLPAILNTYSLSVIKTSHPVITEVNTNNGVVSFSFRNIMLPDSSSQPLLSQGFIMFELTPLSGSSNTVLQNKASIYFDYNPPVVTNTVTNTLTYSVPVYSGNLNATACGYTTINNRQYYTSGNYQQMLRNEQGCDSLLVINAIIQPEYKDTLYASECTQYTLNGITYMQSGIYTQTYTTNLGCDSLITLNLIVHSIDTGLTITNGTLTSMAPAQSFQWFSCDSAAAINGATQNHFTPAVNGYYGALIFADGCVDTTSCYYTTVTGIHTETDNNHLAIMYPNPTNETLVITIQQANSIINATVTNQSGSVVSQWQLKSGENIISCNYLAPGVYTIGYTYQQQYHVYRFIKN